MLTLYRWAQLAGHGARGGGLRLQHARHLHRQRRTAGDDVPVPQPLPRRSQQRERIHAGMPVEEAVLIGQHRLHIARRHLRHPHRVPPDVRAIGKGPQRRAVASEDDLGVGREVGGVAAAGERGREELVGEEERTQR